MSQNRSSAVMQQRAEPNDSLDFFPTPPWATRALCTYLQGVLGQDALRQQTVWEPACGRGDMARPLGEFFGKVYASDVHDYSTEFSDQASIQDFLIDWDIPPQFQTSPPEWVITNPPFRLAQEFVDRSFERASKACAMLVRTSFLEGVGRYRALYSKRPPFTVLQFAERVPMFRGRLDPKGSTATSYCWLVWVRDYSGPTEFRWIPPSRHLLERPGDYPPASEDVASLFDGGKP